VEGIDPPLGPGAGGKDGVTGQKHASDDHS
jgi:hypothetical protein